MGHLSNPIGFRLNFEKKWNFTFFVKNLYYPESINTLINIRDYLYYYFTRKIILQSGLCLSHFLIYKYLKKFHVKVFLYHIDLQKTSYDLINKLFFLYYESYNKVNCKFIKDKTPKQLDTYYNFRDISNADIFVFLYTYKLFYEGSKAKNKYFFNKNIYFNKKNKISTYNKFIIYSYLKQWMRFYKLHIKYTYKRNKKKLKKNFITFYKNFNFERNLKQLDYLKKKLQNFI